MMILYNFNLLFETETETMNSVINKLEHPIWPCFRLGQYYHKQIWNQILDVYPEIINRDDFLMDARKQSIKSMSKHVEDIKGKSFNIFSSISYKFLNIEVI